MSREKIAIVGAGGHTRSLLNLIDTRIYDVTGIFDDSYDQSRDEEIMGIKLTGTIQNCGMDCKLVLSFGDNNLRKKIFLTNFSQILTANLVHRTANFEDSSVQGNSNQIFGKSYFNSLSRIGNNNLINTGAILEHETEVGDHNHISVNATLCGRVKLGNLCFIGAGSVVIDKIKICDNVVLGANSVVIEDITEPGVYVGNPARKIK